MLIAVVDCRFSCSEGTGTRGWLGSGRNPILNGWLQKKRASKNWFAEAMEILARRTSSLGRGKFCRLILVQFALLS